MISRYFEFARHGTNYRTELLAGLTTFLTMAYIIVVQPGVLTGRFLGVDDTGMDFGAVMTATCLSAALASAIMGIYARLPVAQAPGMGQNAFFVLSCLPAAAAVTQARGGTVEAWQVGLGVVFYSGILFLVISMLGIRRMLLEAVSPSLRAGITIGIGLFIAFIGLQNARLVIASQGTMVTMNPQVASPDLVVFLVGLLATAGMMAARVRGSILWGIVAATASAVLLRYIVVPALPASISSAEPIAKSELMASFHLAKGIVAPPPSIMPTLFQMDLVGALAWPMIPFILIFLFMVLFDTLGTLLGVCERAGLMVGNELPRARQALVSDAVGAVAGAALGTSTVTSYVESAAGVEEGGRTGLTAVTVAGLFLLALFFSPLVEMIGSYRAITAPALVVVGSMMMHSVTRIEWNNYAEVMPAFLVMIGIPMTFSIGDGLALGFISYPIVKLIAGQGRSVKWLMYVMAVVLVLYFAAVRARIAG